MSRFLAAFLFVCALGPAAFGQIIYQNVRYQHVTGAGHTFYYGGNAPRTFFWAEMQSELEASGYNRYRYGAFSGGDRTFGDGRISETTRVYSDLIRYRNARRWGFTADDARNEAYRGAPLYFRKRDLLRAAEVQPDGSVVVPSHPRMVVLVDRHRRGDDDDNGATRPATAPTTRRILIIPKPKPATSDKTIVASR